MNKFFIIVFLIFGVISCRQEKYKDQIKSEFSEIIKEGYELYKPAQKAKAVLILFGGFPEVAKDIKREFKILQLAKENNIAVVFSNYNQKLWLTEIDKRQLAESLQKIIINNQLPTNNIYIGGFSSGGVVSLLISNYITEKEEFDMNPKGVFCVDSPIDLTALYASAEKNIARKFSAVSVNESKWIIETLGKAFGNPKQQLKNYENHAVFTYQSNHTANLQHLKNTKIRLYTEPDTLWWKTNRKADFDQMNAFYLEKLATRLQEEKFKNVAYIPTKNKGYRANGERHPHSWAIVNTKEFIHWILEN